VYKLVEKVSPVLFAKRDCDIFTNHVRKVYQEESGRKKKIQRQNRLKTGRKKIT
jgi:hypothetical protein